ncbi:MAG: 50S ribosomal protein L11 methyltransferase [Nitriliruptoraceae bacterium]
MSDLSDHYRLNVSVRYDEHDLVSAWLFSAGALGVVTTNDTLTAWFATPAFTPTPLPRPQALASLDDTAFTLEPAYDWHAAWVATISPVTVGRFVITPAWLVNDLVDDPAVITLIVDPAQAFGSGHHATTAMCLELLEETAAANTDTPWRVADVGCGTGVLGIAAAKLGAQVEAVDTDLVAVNVTSENATTNQVRITVNHGSVDQLTIRPHTLVANLLSDTIIGLADQLVAAPTKDLIVSGISRDHFDRVHDCLAPLTGNARTVRERDGWIAAQFTTAKR